MSRPHVRSSGSNTDRILSILGGFGPDNAAQSTAAVVARTGASNATAYGLIRALVHAGLLERLDHGWVRLGPAAAELFFAPLDAGYGPRTAARAARLGAPVPAAPRSRDTPSRPAAPFDRRLVDLVDHSRSARPAPWRLGFANASLDNPWRCAMLASLRYAVRLHGDEISDFRMADAKDDWRRQHDQIAEMLDAGLDALIISAAPDEDGSLSALLRAAGARGVGVVAVDRRPVDAGATHSFVTASDAVIGRTAALWLAERLAGRGRLWMLSGTRGASPAIRRQSSALEEFARHPGLTVEATANTDWTEAGGRAAVTALLDDLGHAPDGVWCDSGLQGVGAITAFLNRGLQPPPHTGGDLNRMYKLAIHHAVPFMAVDYPAAMGALAVETALSVLRGATLARRIETPIQIIVPRGQETASVRADDWAERHVRWDLPDDAILSQGASLRATAP